MQVPGSRIRTTNILGKDLAMIWDARRSEAGNSRPGRTSTAVTTASCRAAAGCPTSIPRPAARSPMPGSSSDFEQVASPSRGMRRNVTRSCNECHPPERLFQRGKLRRTAWRVRGVRWGIQPRRNRVQWARTNDARTDQIESAQGLLLNVRSGSYRCAETREAAWRRMITTLCPRLKGRSERKSKNRKA